MDRIHELEEYLRQTQLQNGRYLDRLQELGDKLKDKDAEIQRLTNALNSLPPGGAIGKITAIRLVCNLVGESKLPLRKGKDVMETITPQSYVTVEQMLLAIKLAKAFLE